MSSTPYIILGASLILFGIRILVDPVYFSSKYDKMFDFSEISIPFGIFLISIGGYFIWSSIKKK